ncbi:GNAT family N-acetyltransferase [Glaciimonas sp. GNP009]
MNKNNATIPRSADCFDIVLNDGPRVKVVLDGQALEVWLDDASSLRLLLGGTDSATRSAIIIGLNTTDAVGLRLAILGALNFLFATDVMVDTLKLDFSDYQQVLSSLLRSGLAVVDLNGQVLFTRDAFVQQPDLWLQVESSAAYPLAYVISNGKRHPRRPPNNPKTVYRRFIPWLNQWLTLRTLDLDTDLDSFHAWMNNPRVAKFWEEDGAIEKHRAFIINALADPHVHPLIGCLDDKPFGYFEVYWAKEDRIAPFYNATDYDRGLHMLVGEEWARGPHFISAWLNSLVHYVMLDDPRTQLIVCEPRADNVRMIDYLRQTGFAFHREFDFPHKRAALLILEREVFSQGPWITD